MSVPQFPKKGSMMTRDEAINAILISIANEEMALAHIMNAESEKIRYAINCAKEKGCGEVELQEILAVNESVARLIEKIIDLETILKNKLAIVSEHMKKSCHPHPPCPPVPPCPPDPPCPPSPPHRCVSVFTSDSVCRVWNHNKTLFLIEDIFCRNGIHHFRKNGESLIKLPGCKKFKIEIELNAVNKKQNPVHIVIEFKKGKNIVHKENINTKCGKYNVKLCHSLIYETLGQNAADSFTIRLCSPESLHHVKAVVSVTDITKIR